MEKWTAPSLDRPGVRRVAHFPTAPTTAARPRRGPHGPTLTHSQGLIQTFELEGRAVLVHLRFAAATKWLSETPLAQAKVDLAYGRVKVRMAESQPTIEAEDDLGLWPQKVEGRDDER